MYILCNKIKIPSCDEFGDSTSIPSLWNRSRVPSATRNNLSLLQNGQLKTCDLGTVHRIAFDASQKPNHLPNQHKSTHEASSSFSPTSPVKSDPSFPAPPITATKPRTCLYRVPRPPHSPTRSRPPQRIGDETISLMTMSVVVRLSLAAYVLLARPSYEFRAA